MNDSGCLYLNRASIPAQVRAAIRHGSGASSATSIQYIDVSKPGPDQVLVKITCSGLCGSDKSLLKDEWEGFGVGMKPEAKGIPGHEGVGVVVAVGEGHCIKQTNIGFSVPGIFQEYCLADGRYTTKIPEGVLDEEAGPIMSAAAFYLSLLSWSSLSSFTEKNSYEPWNNGVPAVCIHTALDNALPPSLQAPMAARLGSNVTAFTLQTGHCPFISVPEETLEVFQKTIAIALEHRV
ncbi:chaperonin 10-like protein [Ilyonectria destructans]|nr:chaperonin 10-like protein [Ilyonectria destructans]